MSTQITTAAELDALPAGSIVKVWDDNPTAPNSFWLKGGGGLWWTFAATSGYTSADMAEDGEYNVLYLPNQPTSAQPTEEQIEDALDAWIANGNGNPDAGGTFSADRAAFRAGARAVVDLFDPQP